MVGAHVGAVREPFAWGEPATWGDLVNGRSSILFAVLAGVSIALVTGRDRLPAPDDLPGLRLRLLGRGAAIFAIGVALELLGTGVAVILTLYGVLYVAALPFLRWSRRWLWGAVAVLALLGPLNLALLYAVVPASGAWGAGVGLVLGVYPITVWLALLLAGLAIGRSDLSSVRTAVVLLVAGAATSALGYGVAASASSYAAELEETVWGASDGSSFASPSDAPSLTTVGFDEGFDEYDDGGFDEGGWSTYLDGVRDAHPWEAAQLAVIDDSPHSGGTAEILGSGGLAVAVLGLCLLLQRPLRWALVPLAAVGAMPLTVYAAHLLVIAILGGPGGALPDSDTTWLWLTVGLVVGATAWTLLLGRGPLERLVGRAADLAAHGTRS